MAHIVAKTTNGGLHCGQRMIGPDKRHKCKHGGYTGIPS